MRNGKAFGGAALLAGMALAAPLLARPAPAQTALAQTAPLGPNPSECEIQAALLGTAGPGCPPVAMKRVIPLPPTTPPTTAPPTAPPSVRPPAAPAAAASPSAQAAPPIATPTVAAPAPPAELRAAFRISFDFNSARIRPESRAVLDRVGAVMTAPDAGSTRFRIVGHTDAVGSDAANLALSRRRAGAVVDYLAERHGVRRDRLDASGMGAREPLVPADPKAAENRRVEIVNLGG